MLISDELKGISLSDKNKSRQRFVFLSGKLLQNIHIIIH